MPASTDLLTEAEATARVKVFDQCKHPVRQFREWACRQGVPVKRVGRRRLYEPRILDAFLNRENWTKRHKTVAAAKPDIRIVKAG